MDDPADRAPSRRDLTDRAPSRRSRRRFDDEDPPPRSRPRRLPDPAAGELLDPRDPAGPVPSSWPDAVHGPAPRPEWVITEGAALDTDLGLLKTGKEADVHLLERGLPGSDRRVLLAAKRYRDATHRMFHRDAGYLEGRRVRRSRETRAMARRTDFGRELLGVQWATAEFAALSRLWQAGQAGHGQAGGIRVPYPVQLSGTELLLEFIGDADGTPAPRLVQLRPPPEDLDGLWRQVVAALGTLARAGYAHADLSPYNVLVHRGHVVLIDLPQVVDLAGNPNGVSTLARDVRVMARWFAARGLDGGATDPEPLIADLLADAGLPRDAASAPG